MYNQTLEGISLAMERIENRFPTTYQENAKWKQLKAFRDKLSYEFMQEELAHQKVKNLSIGDEESAKLIKTFERLIKKYEDDKQI